MSKKFNSDLILGVTYDAEKKRLEVRYVDGSIFHHFQVPAEIAHRIETAKSAGKVLAIASRSIFTSKD